MLPSPVGSTRPEIVAGAWIGVPIVPRAGGRVFDCGGGRVHERGLVRVAALGRDFVVVLVAGEGRDPVVGAGRGRRDRARVEAAVGFDRFGFRARTRDFVFAGVVGVELEDDVAFAGRVDQAGDRGGVVDRVADRDRGRGRGFGGGCGVAVGRGGCAGVFDCGRGRVHERGLVRVAALGRDFVVVLVAGEGRDPVVGAGRGRRDRARVEAAVGFDRFGFRARARDFVFAGVV